MEKGLPPIPEVQSSPSSMDDESKSVNVTEVKASITEKPDSVVGMVNGLVPSPLAQPNEPNPPSKASSTTKSPKNNNNLPWKFFSSSSESVTEQSSSTLTVDESSSTSISYSMNPSDYEIGPAVGFGSSAIVYHTKYIPSGGEVAVKMIDLDHFERNQIEELRKEIQVMSLCKHPNLLRILVSFVNQSKLWIVMPFLAGGSCLDILKTGFRDGLEETAIATILYQALQGLEYLHRNEHIHRDVKAGNLLMDSDGTVKLADFGVSSSLMEEWEGRKGVRKTFVGTPCWMAPEVMEMSNGYDSKVDIWSFGITALELAHGHAPYAKFPPMKVIYLTLSNDPPTLDRKRCRHKYSKTFKEMIDLCLQKDPSKRPTAEALLKHPFFKTAKKKLFLSTSILASIPPLLLRPRVLKLKKRSSNTNDSVNECISAWDFSTEDDTTENEMAIEGETEEDAVTESRKSSRFVVEAENSSLSSSSTTPKESNLVPTLSTVSKESAISPIESTEDEAAIKKGRFSVLESSTSPTPTEKQLSSPDLPQDLGKNNNNIISSTFPSSNNPIEIEDGRRSRFKVETSSNTATATLPTAIAVENIDEKMTTTTTCEHPPNTSNGFRRFEVTTGTNDHSRKESFRDSNDNIPAPRPQGFKYQDNGILLHEEEDYDTPEYQSSIITDSAYREEYPPHNHPYHQHLHSGPGGHVHFAPHPPYHNQRHQQVSPPRIFVHPSQIDQLLLLNEMIRQQLLDLRNIDYYRNQGSGNNNVEGGNEMLYSNHLGAPSLQPHSSYQSTVHATNDHERYINPIYGWDIEQRLAAAGAGGYLDNHNSFVSPHPLMPMEYNRPISSAASSASSYMKRRSISIDGRSVAGKSIHSQSNHHHAPPSNQHSQRNTAAYAKDNNVGSGVNQNNTSSSLSKSINSPINDSNNISLESLLKEIDLLKRENDLLKQGNKNNC